MSIAEPASRSPSRPVVVPAPGTHHQQLDRLKNQERQRRFIIGVLALMSSLAVLIGLIATADFYLELAPTLRLLLWGCLLWHLRRADLPVFSLRLSKREILPSVLKHLGP